MKKIFTLIAASLFTVALFAADRRPVVTLTSSRGYEVVIDGQSYFSDYGKISLRNIGTGQHMIKVYETSRGYGNRFMKMKRAIAVSSFFVRNNNVDISIGYRGQIMITESRNNGWGDSRDDDRGRNRDNDDRGNQGRDNQYDNNQQGNHDQGNKGNDKPRRF